MGFQKNDIVDYFDNKRIACGLILDVDDRRLRVLNDQGKELKVSAGRALTASRDPGFPYSGTRDQQVSRLKSLSLKRDELKSRIDLKELWEVVCLEGSEICAEDLSELVFGKENDSDSIASLLRAIFEDKLYFKLKPDTIEVPSPERVEQALGERRKELERLTFVASAADFLTRLKEMDSGDCQSAPQGLIQLLEEAALCGQEWASYKNVRQIFLHAGLPSNWQPFTVLVKLGVWSVDENIRLRSEDVPIEFSPEADAQAAELAARPVPASAEDLTGEELITIDAITTRDVDDALSYRVDGEDALVGIHIADVAHFVEHDSALDREIRQRAVSIYLPEITIPMIPPILSEEAASLNMGKLRPALSLVIRFGPDLRPKEHKIVPAIIRVKERLSYEEADDRIGEAGSKEAALFAIAESLRKDRVSTGAIIFKDPELSVRVEETGVIEPVLRDRETPSQILVSEMMILANSLFGRFMKDNDVPGIFRSQPPPTEKIEIPDRYDPVISYRSKRALSRGDVSTTPAPHSTLGLAVYTTATSPLRRYPDLVIQRQIKAALQDRDQLLSTAEMEKILDEISYRLDRAVILERERQRYFLLKYFEQHRTEEFEAIVLHRFPRFHLVQLTRFGINAALNSPINLSLNPYDRAIIRIDKINPREDRLSFSLVRLL